MKNKLFGYIEIINLMENISSEEKKVREKDFQKFEKLKSIGKNITAEFFFECLSSPVWLRSESVRIVGDYCKEDFVWIFGMALNDRSDHVVEEAAQALAKINSDTALEILSDIFFSNIIERPHHIANAISQFGQRGFDVLLKGTKNDSPNIRYYSAFLLGSTGFESTKSILEKVETEDNEKTTFGGLVSTGARKGLKTLNRILERNSKTENT